MSGSCSYLIVDVRGMSNDDGSSDLKRVIEAKTVKLMVAVFLLCKDIIYTGVQ